MRLPIAVALLLLNASPGFGVQQGQAPAADAEAALATVPFGVGERFDYRVKFGPLKVGKAFMEVARIDTVAGHPTYHLISVIQGSTPFYRLDDRQESWLDVYQLASRRYLQDSHQGSYTRFREYELDLENGTYTRNDGASDSIPANALDQASFVYFLRTVPLEVGATYEWNRYFRFDRNPVILRVLRRERVKVPAGEFSTIVVQPIIKTRGIFSEGGEAEIFITEDELRMPVKVKSKLAVGSVTLELTEYVAGERLLPEALGRE
ncbi:MAG: hypothetical protein AMS25_04295 [Gemmatimonas sp. SM23_52]|nr:MAG: hypothetical protein AMS25_04295 [Gemmatimonas sp. SM23_52]